MTIPQLTELLLDRQPADYPLQGYRRAQLLDWVFDKGQLDVNAMSNLPLDARQELRDGFTLNPFAATQAHESRDGSTKFLFTLRDGLQTEAVLMPYANRVTICVSTMVGCPAGCAFCATGALGFGRNLTPGEIIAQVLVASAHANLAPKAIRNLVFMGMGEPLLNYANTLAAARILLNEQGLGFSSRRVTLSTVGLPAQIERLADEDITVKLAISLHAPDEETRRSIIPTAHAHSIDSIIAAAKTYQQRSGRRVTFEYAMLGGINDHDWQADLLAELLRGLIAHVNLIPLNDWPGSVFTPSSEARLRTFAQLLDQNGVPVSIRRSRGRDAGAACGQLALQGAALSTPHRSTPA